MWQPGSKILVPISSIDEASKVYRLVKVNLTGQKALETLFAWFVAMTKEQHKFHMIFCSSMFNWLGNFVDNDRFKVYGLAI